MKKRFFIFFLLGSFLVSAQNSTELEKYKKQYPNATFVRLLQETIYTIKLKEDKIDITKEVVEKDIYLTDGAYYNSKQSLSYSSFFNLEKIEASSLNIQNNDYVEVPVKNFDQKNDLDDSFYDDSKKVSFIYPNLKKGSKTSLKYTYNIKNPRFLSAFYFADFFPIIENKVTIISDRNISLAFKEFHTQEKNIAFEKKRKGKNYIYSWVSNNSEKYESERSSPNHKTFLPHIVPRISSYKVKKDEKKLLDGVQGLYNWYYSLVENVNKEESDQELVALVQKLTKDKKSDLEKVKAIYYWTQKNIKYIAFEYALGGFIPREANDVFKKKYGDCKDNSSILFKMLELAGLKGNLTWIGTRSIPYKYEEVPTPAVDNHMILSYEDNGKTYYLDATGRYIQIDFPSAFIQGKEALVSNGKDSFNIKTVPIISPEKNAVIDATRIQIQNQDILGKASTTMKGYIKNDMFYQLEELKKESDIKDLYNRRFIKGSNKFLISSYQENNKYSYEKDFSVDYDFSIKGYVQNIGNEIFINPHLNKIVSYFKTKKDRKRDIEYEYKSLYSFTNTIEIPEGYQVEYLPTSQKIKNEFITIEFQYTQNETSVVSQQKVTFDYLTLTKEQQKIVNKAIKKAEKAYKEIIILKKK